MTGKVIRSAVEQQDNDDNGNDNDKNHEFDQETVQGIEVGTRCKSTSRKLSKRRGETRATSRPMSPLTMPPLKNREMHFRELDRRGLQMKGAVSSIEKSKKVLIWEWDIGVPIKYISDPTMHSMPVITLHPSGSYFVGQSLDNQIAVDQGRNLFAVQRKKKFTGHQVSGYASIFPSVQMDNLCAAEMEMGRSLYGNGKGANCAKNIVHMIKVRRLDVCGTPYFLLLSLRADGMA